jgi:hypothetical protein
MPVVVELTQVDLPHQLLKRLRGWKVSFNSCKPFHGNSHSEPPAEVLLLQKKKASAAAHDAIQHTDQREEITPILKPKGEAGSKGFKLIREMGLDDTAEGKKLYHAIMVRIRSNNLIRPLAVTVTWQFPFTENCPWWHHQMLHRPLPWLSSSWPRWPKHYL